MRFAAEGAPVCLFDDPPRGLPVFETIEEDCESLPDHPGERIYPHVQRWREQQLNAVSALLLGCVFEGEADYRVRRPPGREGRQWTLNLTTGTLFAIAPGTPFSDGSKVAWERPDLQRAYSRAILLQLRTEGVICHTFTSDKGKLWLHPYIFLYNFEVLPLGEKLLAELRRERPSVTVVYLYWQLIFCLLERTAREGNFSILYTPASVSAGTSQEIVNGVPELPAQAAIQLAEQYIKSHLDDPALNQAALARHIGLSERHLYRLFKKATGVAPSFYLQQKRLEKACVLLQHTQLSIRLVAVYCGFRSLSHFTSWFVRHKQLTPRDFRKEQCVRNMKIMSDEVK